MTALCHWVLRAAGVLRVAVPACSAILATVLLGAGLASPSLADDEPVPAPAPDAAAEEPADPVSVLTPHEVALLEQKVPGWADMDPATRAHIARRVLRLRELNESGRESLRRRVARWRDRATDDNPDDVEPGPIPAGPPPHGQRLRFGAEMGVVAHLLGDRLESGLPAPLRDAMAERGLAGRTLQRHLLEAFMPLVREFEARRLLEADPDAADDAVPSARREGLARLAGRVREAMGREDEASRRDRHRLGFEAVGVLLAATRTPDREGWATLLWERWQPVYEAALQKLAERPEALMARFSAREVLGQAMGLERLSRNWLRDPEHAAAREHAQALLRHLYVVGLGLDPAAVDALPATGDPARIGALRRLLGDRLRGLEASRDGHGGAPPGRRGDKPPGHGRAGNR